MKKITLLSLLIILTALSPLSSLAVDAGHDTRQGANSPSIRSIKASVDGIPLSLPIITLGGDDHILISFDEIADDRRYMRYELIHCDAAWQPEQLVDSEFIEGFNLGDINDYAYSEATTVHYINYRLQLPNEQVRFTASGNYLVRIYPEDDPDQTLLQARFSVVEPGVSVAASVSTVTDIDVNQNHQQVNFTIDAGEYPVDDMFNDLIVVVEQDNRQDNAVTLRQPLRLARSKVAVYEHLRPLIFDAGNEYRRFETVSLTRPDMNVEQISYIDPFYHATLTIDHPRDSYNYDHTQQGAYLVRQSDTSIEESDVRADYLVTHFTLDLPRQQDVDIYIDGDLTDRRVDPTSLMTFNSATGRYEKALLLKQGSYNYQYIAVPRGTTRGTAGIVEGNFAPTNHRYTIKVYHRPRGTRYDRLIGVATLQSAP